MAWTTPRTWTPGELVTASQLNTHLRDNLNFLNTEFSLLARDVTTDDVVNSLVETTVFTASIAGGTLGSDRGMRLTLIGDYLNNAGVTPNLVVRAKYGVTSFAAATFIAIPANASRRALVIDAVLSAAGATNAQVASARITLGAVGSALGTTLTPTSNFVGVRNAHAIDSTSAQTLSVTFEHDTADANISARALSVLVEQLGSSGV